MAKLVIDANIFIDIEAADLTGELFRLSDIIVTPDVLYKEELSDRHPELPILGLEVAHLSGSEVAEVERLRTLYQNPSTNDLFALSLAKARGWTLLGGDAKWGQLRELRLGDEPLFGERHQVGCPVDLVVVRMGEADTSLIVDAGSRTVRDHIGASPTLRPVAA